MKQIMKVVIIFSQLFFGLLFATPALASDSVLVTLPTFPVTLNGYTINNDYNKYPLLVYNDITYFPMTYYDSRFLGLTTDWSAVDGLSIEKTTAPFSEYQCELQNKKNNSKQYATIATGTINVNHFKILNEQEVYPLLLFRDVTYFPLTWNFIVEEFGWNYSFSHENGLVIYNPNQEALYPLHWDGSVYDFGSMMGTGDLKFGVSFQPKMQTFTASQAAQQLSEQTISLYHFSPDHVTVLPSEESWEYHVYYIQDGQEYLVYKKLVPFFSGELNGRQYAHNRISINYWNSGTIKNGTYLIKLIHPETLRYSTSKGETISIDLRDGTGVSFYFESYVTIQ